MQDTFGRVNIKVTIFYSILYCIFILFCVSVLVFSFPPTMYFQTGIWRSTYTIASHIYLCMWREQLIKVITPSLIAGTIPLKSLDTVIYASNSIIYLNYLSVHGQVFILLSIRTTYQYKFSVFSFKGK